MTEEHLCQTTDHNKGVAAVARMAHVPVQRCWANLSVPLSRAVHTLSIYAADTLTPMAHCSHMRPRPFTTALTALMVANLQDEGTDGTTCRSALHSTTRKQSAPGCSRVAHRDST